MKTAAIPITMVNPGGRELSYSSARGSSRNRYVENVTGRPAAFHQYLIFKPIVEGGAPISIRDTNESCPFLRPVPKLGQTYRRMIFAQFAVNSCHHRSTVAEHAEICTRRQRRTNSASLQRIAPPSPVPKTFVA